MVRGYVRESLMKLENVEEKFVEHIDSTSGKINELVGKVDKMSLSKEDKPVPSSFLYKRSVKIQYIVKPIDKFPHLFPKEVAPAQKEKIEASTSEEPISLASLFKEEEKEAKVLPIYGPLER